MRLSSSRISDRPRDIFHPVGGELERRHDRLSLRGLGHADGTPARPRHRRLGQSHNHKARSPNSAHSTATPTSIRRRGLRVRADRPVCMPSVPRVNVDLPDDLHRRAKAAAALQGVTLRDYLIAALTSAVAADEKKPKPKPKR